MSRILAILLLGGENLEKLARTAPILHDLCQEWANCADFAQFAVHFPTCETENGGRISPNLLKVVAFLYFWGVYMEV